MQKVFIVSLIITFLFASQYTYLQASCLLCNQSGEMFKIAAVERSEPEEVEPIFDQLELNEKIELINYNATYTLKDIGAEFIYVSLYDDENRYVLITKDGNLLGAINQYEEKKNIILPQDNQPELICVMTCFLFFSQSAISVFACPLVPIARMLYPSDHELHETLHLTCTNGTSSIFRFLACSGGFCYDGL